ncbi:hypothetical protein Tco_0977402 [Tanacetum coccineum]|uniref:Uncharacterized protein n=1 Tax=Tanacetum coccineum TaxID=301880 RepID=A0ABQ5EK06_9ASTR
MPKSAWTEKDQIDKLLERKKVNEELRKVCWWEIIRRRPTAATKDHMISTYDVLIIQTEMELTLEQTQQGVSYEVSVSIEGVEE